MCPISADVAQPGLDPRPTFRPAAASVCVPTRRLARNHSVVRNRPKRKHACGTETRTKFLLADHLAANLQGRFSEPVSVTNANLLPSPPSFLTRTVAKYMTSESTGPTFRRNVPARCRSRTWTVARAADSPLRYVADVMSTPAGELRGSGVLTVKADVESSGNEAVSASAVANAPSPSFREVIIDPLSGVSVSHPPHLALRPAASWSLWPGRIGRSAVAPTRRPTRPDNSGEPLLTWALTESGKLPRSMLRTRLPARRGRPKVTTTSSTYTDVVLHR